jgi:hypothetical protein
MMKTGIENIGRSACRVPRQITGLLAELGLNYRRRSNQVNRFNGVSRPRYQSFWSYHMNDLPAIFETARRHYRRDIKRLHPDAGGRNDDCARLNLIWGRIRKLFAQKIALVALLVGLPVVAAQFTNVTIQCDYPLDELDTNLVFKVWHSTNLTIPMTNWTVLTNVSGLTATTNPFTVVTLPITVGNHFYALTASNDFGESPFSNVARGQVARSGTISIKPGT